MSCGAIRAGLAEPALADNQSIKVRGIVLAGVHEWGSCVLEEVRCRPLLPVASRPLIWYALRWLRGGGVRVASVCGNSDTGILWRQLGRGDALDLKLDYFEDVMPRGPAGCVRDSALATDAEVVVVVEGTIVPGVDLDALLENHFASGAALTLVVSRRGSQGSVEVEHEPVGIYVFNRATLARIPDTGYQDIKETLIPELYRRGERIVTHVVTEGQTPRVTDAASYLAVNMWTMENAEDADWVANGHQLREEAWVHETAHVDPSARLVGPVLVGADSVIGEEVLIVGPTSIGYGCRLERGVVVTRSAIWNRCEIGPGAILDQCILADDAVIEGDIAVRETACLPPRRSGGRIPGEAKPPVNGKASSARGSTELQQAPYDGLRDDGFLTNRLSLRTQQSFRRSTMAEREERSRGRGASSSRRARSS